jgi:hypothetical protein
MAMDRELHTQQMKMLNQESSSATPRQAPAESRTESKYIREAIRDSLKLKMEFATLGDADMVAFEEANIIQLKRQLDVVAHSTPQTTNTSITPRSTPAPAAINFTPC